MSGPITSHFVGSSDGSTSDSPTIVIRPENTTKPFDLHVAFPLRSTATPSEQAENNTEDITNIIIFIVSILRISLT